MIYQFNLHDNNVIIDTLNQTFNILNKSHEQKRILLQLIIYKHMQF